MQTSILHHSVQLPSNKKFGLFFSIVFAITSTYFFYINLGLFSFILANLSVIFFILALIDSTILLPFNKGWMCLGILLSMIVSPIIMGTIFFTIFTPIGLIMRMFGRDELRLKMKPVSTHWKVRESQADINKSFKNQF